MPALSAQQSLLYQLVKKCYPAFLKHQVTKGRSLSGYAQQEFTNPLKCGQVKHVFLRVRCETCHHEKLVAFSASEEAFTRSEPKENTGKHPAIARP